VSRYRKHIIEPYRLCCCDTRLLTSCVMACFLIRKCRLMISVCVLTVRYIVICMMLCLKLLVFLYILVSFVFSHSSFLYDEWDFILLLLSVHVVLWLLLLVHQLCWAKQILFLLASLCVSVSMSVCLFPQKLKNCWSEIDYRYVLLFGEILPWPLIFGENCL